MTSSAVAFEETAMLSNFPFSPLNKTRTFGTTIGERGREGRGGNDKTGGTHAYTHAHVQVTALGVLASMFV